MWARLQLGAGMFYGSSAVLSVVSALRGRRATWRWNELMRPSTMRGLGVLDTVAAKPVPRRGAQRRERASKRRKFMPKTACSAIAMALQAAPGNDDLPPPGPPRHTSAAQCLTTRTHEASPCAGYPAHGGSLPATYPRKRGPRAWHTGVRQTAQRLGDRGRTSSRATQRHQPLARRTSLRPPVGTSARRG